MGAHSSLGPSAAKRWLNCPGGIALAASVPPFPTSIHAAEGTVAHKIAEQYVTGVLDDLELAALLGTTVRQDDFDIEVGEDMIDGAMEYKTLIDADVAAFDDRPQPINQRTEIRVGCPSIDKRIWGTADHIVYRKGHKLIVYDYKFGKGVVVDAEENEQGMLYLLGAMETEAGSSFDEMEIVICQPRASHIDGTVRRWTVPRARLSAFRARVKVAAAETLNPKAALVSGDWCRWCPARPVCPEIHKAVQKEAQADFGVVPSAQLAKMETRLPDARLMTDAQLVRAFEWEDAINSFFEAVKEVLRERVSSGKGVPGIKLVEGRSNRQWTSEDEVAARFGPVVGEALYEKKILSPAKLEKIVGKGKVDSLTFKPEGKKSIALDRDPRPAVKSSAQEDFAPLPLTDTTIKAQMALDDDALLRELDGGAVKEPLWPA